jgi:amino acid transporter
VNALLVGAGVRILFILLVFPSSNHDVKIGFITYQANVNALVSLVSLVSFGVSGIYLSALMTVIGSMLARSRGWIPQGQFRLGRWGWPVSIAGAVYLALMLLNVVAPTGLSSPGLLQPELDDAAGHLPDCRRWWAVLLRLAPGPGGKQASARHGRADWGRTSVEPPEQRREESARAEWKLGKAVRVVEDE